MMYY